MEERFKKYIDYIANTGGFPTIDQFDDDWDPVGPTVRKDLIKFGLVQEFDGIIIKKLKPIKRKSIYKTMPWDINKNVRHQEINFLF